MTLCALRYLIALADCLNFTRAAERCAVTQSTLSIQLRKLKDYLGIRLFERDRVHVELTAEGRKILRGSRVAGRGSRVAPRIALSSPAAMAEPAPTCRARPCRTRLLKESNSKRTSVD